MKKNIRNVAIVAFVFFLSGCSVAQPTIRNDQASSQSSEPVPEVVTVETSWAQSASDKRPLLTDEGINDIRQRLIEAQKKPENGEFMNIDDEVEKEFHLTHQRPSDTTVSVSVPSWNIASIDLPYSNSWVSDTFALPPYYVRETNVAFGPLVYDWHGMQFFRTMWMEARDARTAAQAMEDAKADSFLKEGAKPTQHTVGGRDAVMYVIEQPESAPITKLEVVTPLKNYVLMCWNDGFGYKGTTKQSCSRLLDIAASIRLEGEASSSR